MTNGKKMAASIIMILLGAAILGVLIHFTPVFAVLETPSETAGTTLEATSVSTFSATPTETESNTTLLPTTTTSATAVPVQTVVPTQTVAPVTTPVKTAVPTKAPTKVPTATPAPTKTTPPKLELLTPPGLSAEIDIATPGGETPAEGSADLEISASPEASATGEAGGSLEVTPSPSEQSTQIAHVEQVEIDPGFRTSDFIQILCYIVYGLAGLLLLAGILRVFILLVFKKDIFPSRKERQKAKEAKARREAMKENKLIQTDVSPEEFDVQKDTWKL